MTILSKLFKRNKRKHDYDVTVIIHTADGTYKRGYDVIKEFKLHNLVRDYYFHEAEEKEEAEKKEEIRDNLIKTITTSLINKHPHVSIELVLNGGWRERKE